ncbi:MAG TPA: hypothetical protein VKE95_12515 [Burkholderiales bacterium]|nr:hypothetical protein [Burkholderiales bacterium]
MFRPRHLLNHRRRHYSQSGEDGLIDYMLRRLSGHTELSRYFVEFGAWDGRHLSNTFFLAERRAFGGLLIEADAARYRQLCENMRRFPGVVCVNRTVAAHGTDRLDEILRATGAPCDFDVLSIDVDGMDYWIWQGLQDYRPKIVVIEINYRVKPGVCAVHDPAAPFVWGVSGSSITSMAELGSRKGYELVANVGCNAVFIRRDLASRFQTRGASERELFTYEGFALGELAWSERLRRVGERLRKGLLLGQ